MDRRDALRTLFAMSFPGALAACGGGGSSSGGSDGPAIAQLSLDKDQYFIGETATLTAQFSGGSGRLEPGGIPVSSGVAVVLPKQTTTQTVRLVVTAAVTGASVFRDIVINVAYRNALRTLPMGFARAAHATAKTGDGKLYVIGGEDGGYTLPASVMVFDAHAETFSVAGNLSSGRVEHTATSLADGSILVVGGTRSVTGAPIAERFLPATGASHPTAGQPLASRSLHTATLLADGRVLLLGGRVTGEAAFSTSADLYDPASGQFMRLGIVLQYGRVGHSATRLANGKVLIYGGVDGSGNVRPPELFDPVAMSFTTLPGLPGETVGRYKHVAVPSATSQDLFIVGGEDYLDSAPFDTVVRVASTSNAVSLAGTLQSPRSMLAAAPLGDGRIFVTGGSTSMLSKPVATTEFYSVANSTSVAGPAMSVARMNHTADLLVSGKVLVIGGNDANHAVADTAELFD